MIIRMLFLMMGLVILAASADQTLIKEKKLQDSFWQIYTNALRGDKAAEYQVGVMYERGMGVEQDLAKSALWYEKAAWQGHVDAQYNLALMYAAGRGVDENEERAMIWLAKAAKQGDKEARKLLLAIIDGTLEKPQKRTAKKKNDESSGEVEAIEPVTLTTREGAQVCTSQGKCSVYKIKTTLTSKSKRGKYYKISGMATKQGWKAFEGEGWIDEESVDIRR